MPFDNTLLSDLVHTLLLEVPTYNSLRASEDNALPLRLDRALKTLEQEMVGLGTEDTANTKSLLAVMDQCTSQNSIMCVYTHAQC